MLYIFNEFIFSRLNTAVWGACGIPDQAANINEIIITGGWNGNTWLADVSVYTEAGFSRSLAPLNTARNSHGCTSFVKEGKRVKMTKYNHIFNIITISIL